MISIWEKNLKMEICINMCTTESLCYVPETNTTLSTNYTPIIFFFNWDKKKNATAMLHTEEQCREPGAVSARAPC